MKSAGFYLKRGTSYFPAANLSITTSTMAALAASMRTAQYHHRAGGWVYANSSAEALALCQANLSNVASVSVDQASRFGTIYIYKLSSGQGKRSKLAARKIKPFVATGVVLNEKTNLKLSAVSGLRSGIQFQRVGSAGVGIADVLELGVLHAVDVWVMIRWRLYRVLPVALGASSSWVPPTRHE